MSERVVMFCFGGRRANLELQLPFIRRILEENPKVSYHLWNLAKDPADDRYIRSLSTSARFQVINDFHGPNPWERFNDVYRHYAQPRFKGCLFVKMDDDVVFIETDEFYEFVLSITHNRHAVLSANVINNGACTAANTRLNEKFRKLRTPLLNVHLSAAYAEMCHQHFFDNWLQIVNTGFIDWVPTKDWLSINFIGYDYDMARQFAKLLDTPSPRVIAGRHFRGRAVLGDEGMVNTLPRIIVKGFTACHLTFGPQERKLLPERWTQFRKQYAEIGGEYLAAVRGGHPIQG